MKKRPILFYIISTVMAFVVTLQPQSVMADTKKSAKASAKPSSASKTSAQAGQKKKKNSSTIEDDSIESSPSSDSSLNERPAPTKKAAPPPAKRAAFVGLSADLGYEATYGNGATLHLYPVSMIDLNAGVGYNTSGLKAGAGPGLIFWFTQSAGLLLGASYVYSQGTSGSISLDANFTPEGGGAPEKIKATKKYKVSPAQMIGSYAGMTFHLADAIRIDLRGCYNSVIAGNKVTFEDGIEYSKGIAPTNEDGFNKQFDDQASELVQSGGLGFSIGLQFLL